MKFLKAFSAVLLLGCICTLRADVLDELDKDIDKIERGYWRAICNQQTDAEYYTEVRNWLDKAQDKANVIQNSLLRARCESKYGNINKEISILRNRYKDFAMSPVRYFNIKTPSTSLEAYNPVFLRTQKNKKSNVKLKATLRNVNFEHYDNWLTSVIDQAVDTQYTYRSAYRHKRPKEQDRREAQLERTQEAVNEFLSQIRKIRLLLVDIRQLTDQVMRSRK